MKLALMADRPDPQITKHLVGAAAYITLGDLHPTEVPAVRIPHLYVNGNHDSPNDPFSLAPNRHDLHLNVLRVGGLSFAGFQGSKRYKPRGYFLYDDDEVASMIDGFPAVDVFVAHAPCTGLGIDDGVHDGFRAFDRYLARAQPRIFLCGHVHRQGEVMLGRTRCMSIYGAAEILV